MKISFKFFYYYFVVNDVGNNIDFQIDENIIYEYTINIWKKPVRLERGTLMTFPKKYNNNIINEKNVRYCNLKCTFFVPNFPKI